MIGFAMISVEVDDEEEKIVFTSRTGAVFEMFHEHDCCETVAIDDIIGDLQDLVGSPILQAEEVSEDDPKASESGTWTFYKFTTFKGRVTIRWYGSSNGYYSESVSIFKKDAENVF